jgi:hypothetical protein
VSGTFDRRFPVTRRDEWLLRHPALAALRDHLVAVRPERSDDDVIGVPDWATSRFDVEKP